jgi:hypothetical protein
MGEGRITVDEPSSNHRLTVPEAAARLGITEAAVRGRVKRGTLRSYREAGAVYVLVASSETIGSPASSRGEPKDEPTDQSELVAVLREQLAEEREARRRADTIIAQLSQAAAEQARTIRALEAGPDPGQGTRDSEAPPTPPPETSEGSEARPHGGTHTGGASEAAEGAEHTERVSWWRRWFG